MNFLIYNLIIFLNIFSISNRRQQLILQPILIERIKKKESTIIVLKKTHIIRKEIELVKENCNKVFFVLIVTINNSNNCRSMNKERRIFVKNFFCHVFNGRWRNILNIFHSLHLRTCGILDNF